MSTDHHFTPPARALPGQLTDELDLLDDVLPLADQQILELGCGAARLARALVLRHPGCKLTAVEVDARQHAKNLAQPQAGITFLSGVAQQIPWPDGCADLVLMLKSLHHVPMAAMGQALAEVSRVLRPGGHLYVSEPVYAGPFNALVRLFNDEQVVRAAAQAALDQALLDGPWREVLAHQFEMPAHFEDFDSFERQLMRPTFADHQIDAALAARVKAAFEQASGPDGAHFMRPMHLRLLQRLA